MCQSTHLDRQDEYVVIFEHVQLLRHPFPAVAYLGCLSSPPISTKNQKILILKKIGHSVHEYNRNCLSWSLSTNKIWLLKREWLPMGWPQRTASTVHLIWKFVRKFGKSKNSVIPAHLFVFRFGNFFLLPNFLLELCISGSRSTTAPDLQREIISIAYNTSTATTNNLQ